MAELAADVHPPGKCYGFFKRLSPRQSKPHAGISLVGKLWGSKQVESARKSSENRASEIGD